MKFYNLVMYILILNLIRELYKQSNADSHENYLIVG